LTDATPARAAALHAAAILAAIIVFAVIFTYTGDADLLFAISGGFGTGLLIYLTAHIFRDPSGEK
jgi:hypothetical protein